MGKPPPNQLMKLNFGCGDHILDGWVNADRFSEPPCLELGAVPIKPYELSLPWDDDTFDQVLLAHVIEHIPLDGDLTAADQKARGFSPTITVQQVLAELHRVTKPGGSCLFIGPDIKKYLNLFLNMHSSPEMNSEGEVHRTGQFWELTNLMREGAIEEWIAGHVDPSRINTRRHDVGISSADDPEKGFSFSEVEEIITILFEAIFGNFVLENDIHLGQSDHRWNCYEDRLFNFVSEVFPSVERTPTPPPEEGGLEFCWTDRNGLEWPTRSWHQFSCAVMATK